MAPKLRGVIRDHTGKLQGAFADSSAPPFYGQHPHRNPAVHNNIPDGTMTHNSVEPLDKGLCQNLGMHLPHLNGFNEGGSQVFKLEPDIITNVGIVLFQP
ncbi:hypothetical protein JHK82_016603 [Glycine max]|nr:hypothetical protein JHK82_016603 [Glycine max]